ncbi:MAG: ABC transporter permease [Microscillaceae bacterium]|nr:ABC transporter permease [Microscillaceae bacterium]MDW8461932.1 ABC transporter permease [Cytophagales bacterium]
MSSPNSHPEQWTEIITSQSSWFDLRLNELWRYRDLVMLFVWRDFVAQYKQTILGPLWHIIQPLTTTIIFTIVFGNIAQIPTDGQPAFLFYMSGITIWNYFAACLNKTSSTFTDNAAIFGKVYFPRLTVPVATVISGLFSFGIQLGIFLVFYAYFAWGLGVRLQLNGWLLAIPYLVFLMAVLGLGLGIIVSALTTKYRDLKHLVSFGVQLLMYATPVIYPLSALSEKYRYYVLLNPISPVVEGFRYAFFGEGIFSFSLLVYSTIFTAMVFLVGLALFHKVEKTFMDTV